MSVKIKPSPLNGAVKAPPSKSVTHRYLVISALAEGESMLRDPLVCVDTLATVNGLRRLGVLIDECECGWRVKGGGLYAPDDVIDCNESGTTLRLLTGASSLLQEAVTLSGAPSLLRRPNKPLLDALNQLGAQTSSVDGYPPVTVMGRIHGGRAEIRGDVSSQFISAILLAAPYAVEGVELTVTGGLESCPYVELTMDTMTRAGVKPIHSDNMDRINVPLGEYSPINRRVEGDWSSAAYMLAMGVIAGKIHVDNLDLYSKQADKKILYILNEMGAYTKIKGNRVTVEKSRLKGVEVDLSDSPDLFPVVACLCSVAEGTSMLTGLRRLKYKESDRLKATVEGLKKMGVAVKGDASILSIKGVIPHGAVINPHNDHRIAMSFAVLAQATRGETTIMNPECVTKSYPGFWRELEKIGGRIN